MCLVLLVDIGGVDFLLNNNRRCYYKHSGLTRVSPPKLNPMNPQEAGVNMAAAKCYWYVQNVFCPPGVGRAG